MLWVFYGLPLVHPNSTLVITINGVGLAIEAAYLILFLVYAPNRKRLWVLAVLALEAVLMAALVLGVLLGAHTHDSRSMIVGILCVIANTCIVAQLILYGCYYKSTPKKAKNVELPTIADKTVSTNVSIAVEK
ncbi:hypothetical protein ACQ4PT_020779 [Festuca glaucescens]